MSAVAVDRLHSGSAGPPPLQQAAWKPNILSLRRTERLMCLHDSVAKQYYQPTTSDSEQGVKQRASGAAGHQLPSLSLVAANSSPNRRWSGSTARASR
jgi:hypothetical protein